MSERVLHCWEDGPRTGESWESVGVGSTCMLADGHEGPHVFTPDDQITVSFMAESADE